MMTSLSHDVRTPLTTLLGYLDAVHGGVVTGKSREDYFEIARRKAHDLKDYIDILSDWFKLNSSEFSLSIPIFEEQNLNYNIKLCLCIVKKLQKKLINEWAFSVGVIVYRLITLGSDPKE